MRAGIFFICASLASVQLLAGEGPEDKLLQGELLEVSSGDLEKAMAIYKAIEADEKAPEPTRARALLCLARCQRKLGELEAAKKTLDALIKAHANERDVIRQAQSFLKELEDGRATNPDFDWLKDLEKSPEIQARVFDLAMDLMSPEEQKSSSARLQLLALGTIAVPVMDRVLEVSRDALQRQKLASILVTCGRYERVAVILDPAQPPSWNPAGSPALDLFYQIEAFSEEGRRNLLAAIDKLPPNTALDGDTSLLRLAAGDRRDLLGLLKASEGIRRWEVEPWESGQAPVRSALQWILKDLAKKEDKAAAAMAQRVLDPECPFHIQDYYVSALAKSAPRMLGTDPWVAYLERCNATPARLNGKPSIAHWLKTLEQQERFDVLARVACGDLAGLVGKYFWDVYVGPGKDLREVADGWAAVLRAASPKSRLQYLAEANDTALPQLVAFLRNRVNEEPEYVSWGHWSGKLNWKPSPAYFEAMAGLLDDKDPVTVAIAVEALSLAPERNPPGATEKLERVARESEDGHVREFALYALLECFSKEPATGPAVTKALFREFQARQSVAEPPEAYRKSPLAAVGTIGNATRWHKRNADYQYGQTLDWLLGPLFALRRPEELTTALYSNVFAISDSAAGARFHDWCGRATDPIVQTILFGKLAGIQSAELKESVVQFIWRWFEFQVMKGPRSITSLPPETLGRLVEFMKQAAGDERLSTEARAEACIWAQDEAVGTLDWPRLLGSGHPLASKLVLWGKDSPQDQEKYRGKKLWEGLRARPEKEFLAIVEAGLSSPHENVRQMVARQLPLDRAETPTLFRRALGDASRDVRGAAINHLQGASRADVGPLYVELLGHADQRLRIAAADRLPKFASAECIEPLTKMLDDTDVEVRDHALTALKKVKSALEEKKEWQDLVKKLKEGKG